MLSNPHTRAVFNSGSGIRSMFMKGRRMKSEGKDPIDLSLGNPDIKPPEVYYKALIKEIKANNQSQTNSHKYMPNEGYPETRESVSQELDARFDLPFKKEHIVMTAGAANALDVLLMTLINPKTNNLTETKPKKQEEVIVVAPYFVEYSNYIKNNQGKTIVVCTDTDFNLNLKEIKEAITPRTRAIILNSPNNPTGAVYGKKSLEELAQILTQAEQKHTTTIACIEDSPYEALIFGDAQFNTMLNQYRNTFYVTSHSKSLGIAGERIGLLAMHPKAGDSNEDRKTFLSALTTNLRTRIVNAPGLQQKIIGEIGTFCTGDISQYEGRVNRLADALEESGFELVRPKGAFYLFPKIPDQFSNMQEFEERVQAGQEPLLYTPGIAFGHEKYSRHIRLSACASDYDIERACKKFREL